MNGLTVHELRKVGLKVRVEHRRRYYDPVNGRWSYLTRYERENSELPEYVRMHEKGGKTVVQLNVKGTEYVGIADCSKNDSYNRRLGTKIALGRAIEESGKELA